MKTIKHVDVWSLAKLNGAIAFVVGFILGLIQWLSLVLLGTAFQGQVNAMMGRQIISLGTFASLGFIGLVFFAAFIAVAGFLGGALAGSVYNFIAARGGGVKVELANEE